MHLGFHLRSPGHALPNFARFVEASKHTGALTVELMAQWARQAQGGKRPAPRRQRAGYHLEGERQNAVRSRNARLAALRTFLKFAARRDVGAMQVVEQALGVPMK